jgi:DNA anti-recombination protein RmuC
VIKGRTGTKLRRQCKNNRLVNDVFRAVFSTIGKINKDFSMIKNNIRRVKKKVDMSSSKKVSKQEYKN